MKTIARKRGFTIVTRRNLFSALLVLGALILVAGLVIPQAAVAGTAAEIDRDVDRALEDLYASSPAAKKLSGVAKGIAVFPAILKAGFIIGAQGGEGALREGGRTVGYYNSVSASYGLQAGIQKFGYALFFMTDEALDYLKSSAGWEIGVGPSVVVVDAGLAKSLTTTTGKEDIYAFFFDQKGLMAGLGLQGSKMTKINPD